MCTNTSRERKKEREILKLETLGSYNRRGERERGELGVCVCRGWGIVMKFLRVCDVEVGTIYGYDVFCLTREDRRIVTCCDTH